MPLATQDDVRDALRRVLTDSEEEWADALIYSAIDKLKKSVALDDGEP